MLDENDHDDDLLRHARDKRDEIQNSAVFHTQAINSPGSFAAITLESFVGGTPAAGPSVPVDPQAGNRSDYWCGLAATTVPTLHANRPDLARIAGTGQVFSHFAATASRSEHMQMRPVTAVDGPLLHFPIMGQMQPCLQVRETAPSFSVLSFLS